MTATMPPFVIAACDQFMAAAADDATLSELGGVVYRWLEPWFANGAPAAQIDLVVEQAAFHLASLGAVSDWEVHNADGSPLDPSEALVHRPEHHGFVVPMTMIDHLNNGEPDLARDVWGVLALDGMNESARNARANVVISALAFLALQAHFARPQVSA